MPCEQVERFEVLLPVQHRGSADWDDKLLGKAKKGETITGSLITSDGREWVCLADQMSSDIFLPLEGPNGQQILRRLGAKPFGGSRVPLLPSAPTDDSRKPASTPSELNLLHIKGDQKFGVPASVKKQQRSTQETRASGAPTAGGGGARVLGVAAPLSAGLRSKLAQKKKPEGPVQKSGPAVQLTSAATSHLRNDAYMREFEEHLRDDGVSGTEADPYLHVQTAKMSSQRPLENVQVEQHVRNGSNEEMCSANMKTEEVPVSGGSPLQELRHFEIASNSSSWTSVKHGQEREHWAAGRWIDVSDRNILCMAKNRAATHVLVGGCDHLVKELEVSSGTVSRLFSAPSSETLGHKDWVTACCYAEADESTVISGGADSKICVWSGGGGGSSSSSTAALARGRGGRSSAAARIACKELAGHRGSISKILAKGTLAVSASYDKTLRVWDLKTKREACTLAGHSAPVLDFLWSSRGGSTTSSAQDSSFILSGDRSGVCKLWDLGRARSSTTGTCIQTLTGHKGHITALQDMACSPPRPEEESSQPQSAAMPATPTSTLFLTGAQDGHVRAWDPRQARCAHNFALHTGAVNNILVHGERNILTVGADGVVKWTDVTAGSSFFELGPVSGDFVYTANLVANTLVLGDGHGFLTFVDAVSGEMRSQQKICENAIRAVVVASCGTLVATGDDGNVQFFDKVVRSQRVAEDLLLALEFSKAGSIDEVRASRAIKYIDLTLDDEKAQARVAKAPLMEIDAVYKDSFNYHLGDSKISCALTHKNALLNHQKNKDKLKTLKSPQLMLITEQADNLRNNCSKFLTNIEAGKLVALANDIGIIKEQANREQNNKRKRNNATKKKDDAVIVDEDDEPDTNKKGGAKRVKKITNADVAVVAAKMKDLQKSKKNAGGNASSSSSGSTAVFKKGGKNKDLFESKVAGLFD
ncbi:unnamed protein product [Amoebophrya sp. A120]|nr:unnamed protein product [Amoebophrya sp. A120]|eukprot:GSA120T00005072001.1